jgi:hypothetical protein
MIRRSPKSKLFLWIGFPLFGLALGAVLYLAMSRRGSGFPGSESDYYMPDPVLGHRHRPYARREFAWPEHAKGRIVMRTNNLGMRRDQDVLPQKEEGVRRVLVLGDSNFDGVLNNDESFAAFLESLMNAGGSASPRFEVLNAATGHYGPDNYRGALDAYGPLSIDAVVVGFYSGNDFLDAARILEDGLPRRLDRPRGYRAALRRADRVHAGAVAQLLNQAYYFSNFPEMRPLVLARVEELLRDMNECARQKGIPFFVVLIPTKYDLEPELLGTEWADAVRELRLADEALRITPQMRAGLWDRLRQAGVICLDPTDSLKTHPAELFWKRDYHLNVMGHQALAQSFHRAFSPQLAGSLLGRRVDGGWRGP